MSRLPHQAQQQYPVVPNPGDGRAVAPHHTHFQGNRADEYPALPSLSRALFSDWTTRHSAGCRPAGAGPVLRRSAARFPGSADSLDQGVGQQISKLLTADQTCWRSVVVTLLLMAGVVVLVASVCGMAWWRLTGTALRRREFRTRHIEPLWPHRPRDRRQYEVLRTGSQGTSPIGPALLRGRKPSMSAVEFPGISQAYQHVARGVTQAQRAGLLSEQQVTEIVERLKEKARQRGDLHRTQARQDETGQVSLELAENSIHTGN